MKSQSLLRQVCIRPTIVCQEQCSSGVSIPSSSGLHSSAGRIKPRRYTRLNPFFVRSAFVRKNHGKR